MGLKIEPVSDDVLEAEFGTSGSGNDTETVAYIRTLDIGKGFNVQADGDETPRKVKRRINACAKEAFRELEWHDRAAGGFLARVKAIDAAAEQKWVSEQSEKAIEAAEAKNASSGESSSTSKSTDAGSTNGRQASREKAGAAA